MEATRWLAALFLLIILFVKIYYNNKSVKMIATLGLPVALIVFVDIIYWLRAMGDMALPRSDIGDKFNKALTNFSKKAAFHRC